MFPFTDRLETKENPVDMFLCTYVDMFPQTDELSDIKMNVSSHVETVCLLSNRKPDTKVRIDVDLEDHYRIKDEEKNQN